MDRMFAQLALALAVIGFGHTTASAQSWPSRPITIVVPAPPGGAIDITARLIGGKLATAVGQPVTIENKAGAATVIGTEAVAKANPDGHTLLIVASAHTINPFIFKKLPYDSTKGFEAVIQTHIVPLVMVVTPSLPVKSVAELIAYAKANPDKLSYASSGSGAPNFMSAELLKALTGIRMTHVPYKGSTAAHADLLSGRTQVMFDTTAAIAPHIKSGGVRALAVTTAQRSASLPDVPTLQEAGIKDYEASTWGGILVPAGTPRDIITRLNLEIGKALASPDVRATMTGAGIETGGGTAQFFADFMRSELGRWQKVAQTAGIQPE